MSKYSNRQHPVSKNKNINVVLMTPDQMRADHLHCYGYFRKTSPYIDKLAYEGTLFKRCYTVASWTTPSFCSIMASLVPSRHGATLFGSSVADPNIPLLSKQFKAAGYMTVAFCNNNNASGALNQDWSAMFEGEKERPQNITEHFQFPASETNPKIFKWLDQYYDRPFFMWIAYYEPHSPYNPPPKHDIFKTSAYPNEMNTGCNPDRNGGYLYRLANIGDKEAVERLNGLYDGKIHFTDYYIGQILKKLRELNIDKRTLFIFTSDHGELLYEHIDCLTFDHRSLYDSNIHVPLILQGPSIPRGKCIDAMVSTLDIVPTILEIAGLPPLKGTQGKSLFSLITGRVDAIHDYIFAEQDILEPLRSVRNKKHKLIRHLQDGKLQLYNTIVDPGEKKDVSGQNPEVVRVLGIQLAKHMKKNEPSEEEKLRRLQQARFFQKIIVDEVTIGARLQFFGISYDEIASWVNVSNGGGNYHDACYWIKPGDGSKGALWRSDNPLLGTYNIYVWYGRLLQSRSATNAHFIVSTRKGSWTFVIDQNKNTGKWNLLGEFKDPLCVKVTNEADGSVIIDAVEFEQKSSKRYPYSSVRKK